MTLLRLLPLALSSLILSATASPTPQASPLPVVIWHGLGDSFDGEGIQSVAQLAVDVHPGTYVRIVQLGEDGSADRSSTFFGNLTEQIETVCETFKADPRLMGAPAIDAVGFSQGGLFLRGYVERCADGPPIRSLVTFGSPHNGIADIVCQSSDWLCRGAIGIFKSNAWSGYVQNKIVPAQYYRTLDEETLLPSQQYLENSNFLADANNERELKNVAYAKRLSALDKFVMYLFEEDETVIPKESSWFSEVYLETGEITELRNRTLYKEDWLGLKKLDKKGALEFRTIPGRHMQLSDEILTDAFEKYFGPTTKSREMIKQDPSLEL
jgi:palmitoyl-protein thioesterase